MLCGHCKGKHETVAEVRVCASHDNFVKAGSPRPSTWEAAMISLVDPRPPTALERVKAASAQLPERERVYYAIKITDCTMPDIVTHYEFYRVDKPQKGKWKGYTFLKIQASDALYGIRDYDRIANVLEAIAHDVQGALAAYGREIGRCGICHRTLTDPESIARGIGPICAEGLVA